MPSPLQVQYAPFIVPQATSTYDAGVSGVSRGYITPAATFTATTASSAAAGAKTTLTSAGAHGLTSAVAVNKTIYISAGTNWTAGFYNISSIDLDTTGVAITIDVAFNAAFGSPTIALAGTEITFRTIQIPPLGLNSWISLDATWSMPNNANSKRPRANWAGFQIYAPNLTTVVGVRPTPVVVQNRGATNSQILCFHSGTAGFSGSFTTAPTTYSIDTLVATEVTIGGSSQTANDFLYLDRYILRVYL